MKSKLKKVVLATALSAALVVPQYAFAAETQAGPTSVTEEVKVQGESLVPLRWISEQLGAQVGWEPEVMGVTVQYGQRVLYLEIGADEAVVDGETVSLSHAAIIEHDSTYIPLSLLHSFFKSEFEYTVDEKVVIPESDVDLLGARWIHWLQTGEIESAAAQLSKQLSPHMPAEHVAVLFQQLTSLFGPNFKLVDYEIEVTSVHHNAVLTYQSDVTVFQIVLRFDEEGKVDDIHIPVAPNFGYEPPQYDQSEQYTEHEITIGESPFALPATVTIPNGDGPFPVAVFVHGSGPSDRDESVGAYKTFRDLAVGLANDQIASIRFDKRTFVHPLKLQGDLFTVYEESVEDALFAAAAVQQFEQLNADQIYLVGHSQGGMLVPNIIEHDQDEFFKGAVIMASPTIPLEDVVKIQLEDAIVRAEALGQPTDEIAAQLQQWEMLYAVLKDESIEEIPAEWGFPDAAWWLDFRNHYTAELVKEQSLPVLILQGANDVQVKVEELARWKETLAGRSNVEFAEYPNLNHFFVHYSKPSTGEEYMLPGSVSTDVISDIVEWMKQR